MTAVYLIALAALYLGFELYARTAPGSSGSGAEFEFIEFTLVAVILGIVGAVVTLSPAPRSIIRRPDGLTVIGRWGRPTEWGPLDRVTVHRVRQYPAGFFSESPVDSVEVSGSGRRPRSYLVEAGLLPESYPEPRRTA